MSDTQAILPVLADFAAAFDQKALALLSLGPDLNGAPHSQEFQNKEFQSEELLAAMRYALIAPGKKLRPFLLAEAAKIFGLSWQDSLQAAVAIEAVHCYSLVHDDLPAMDDDDMRRGRPTAHKAFGEATAILAGDALLTWAFELLADENCHKDPSIRAQTCLILARAAGPQGMVAGQMMDMRAGRFLNDRRFIEAMQARKTGALIEAALLIGARLGKASDADAAKLRAYGQALGLAFQVVDDLLDREGDAHEMGKAAGKDKAAGKASFVDIMGLEGARAEVQNLLEKSRKALDGFGDEAENLRLMVDFMRARRH